MNPAKDQWTESNQSSPHKAHLWRGVLLAPWIAPITVLLIEFLFFIAKSHRLPPYWMTTVGGAFVVGLPFSYLVTCLLGLPYVLWLRSINQLKALWVCLGAGLIGAAVILIPALPFSVNRSISTILSQCAIGFGIGLATGAGFWLIAGLKASKPS